MSSVTSTDCHFPTSVLTMAAISPFEGSAGQQAPSYTERYRGRDNENIQEVNRFFPQDLSAEPVPLASRDNSIDMATLNDTERHLDNSMTDEKLERYSGR